MLDPMLMLVESGGYISIIKLLVFLLLFFPAWLLVNWIHKDAKAVEADEVLWTAVLVGIIGITSLLWFLIPMFAIGVVCFLLLVGGAGLAYVKHRNARVLDFDRVLTPAHIKSLISGKGEESEGMEGFTFITANKNEVPRPEVRTPDFFGYRAAYDILLDGISHRAELIMFAPSQDVYKVTYQIDGSPSAQPDQQKDQMDYFVRFAKQLGGLDIKERRKPQKGAFKTQQGKTTIEWEIRTAGSTAGEQISIKKASKQEILRLGDLGLTKKQEETFGSFKQITQGIVLISGPKTSGTSSTFYSLLRNLDAYVNNIYTLEKEVTASVPSVTQEVYSLSDTASTTYANKLEQACRMGPDIVGVAECVDADTAKTVCNAAAEGKMVYVVLEGDSVLQILGRWLKLVGDRQTAVEHLIGISNQRLLRRLCEECKQGYAPNQDVLKKFNLPADKAKALYRPGKVIYDKRGKESMCEDCYGTGFVGRVGVYETIALNDELKQVILKSKTLQEMGGQFRRAKMAYLQEQALRKVMAGTTAINEMVRVLTPPKKKARKAKKA